jgi:CHAT domain-containing protein
MSWRVGHALLALLVLTCTAGAAPKESPCLPCGFTEGLTPDDLQEALSKHDRDRVTEMIRQRSRLVNRVLPRLVDDALLVGEPHPRGGRAELTAEAREELLGKAQLLAESWSQVSGEAGLATWVARVSDLDVMGQATFREAREAHFAARKLMAGGQSEDALVEVDRAAALWQDLDLAKGVAEATWLRCGAFPHDASGLEERVRCGRAAAEFFRDAEMAHTAVDVLQWIGRYEDGLDRPEGALRTLEEALEILNSSGDLWRLEWILLDVGWELMRTGEEDRALATYDRLSRMARELGDSHHLAEALMQQGILHERRGRYLLALQHDLRAMAVKEESGAEIGTLWLGLAESHRRLGLPLAGLRLGRRFLEWAKPGTHWELRGRSSVADCLVQLGDWTAAEDEWLALLRSARSQDNAERVIVSLRGLVEARERRGEAEGAEAALQELLEVVEGLGPGRRRLQQLQVTAETLERLGRREASRLLYAQLASESEEALRQGGHANLADRALIAHTGLADLALQAGDLETVRGEHRLVRELVDAAEDVHPGQYFHLARYLDAEGDHTGALETYRRGVTHADVASQRHGASSWVREEFRHAIGFLLDASRPEAQRGELAAEALVLAQRVQAVELREALHLREQAEAGEAHEHLSARADELLARIADVRTELSGEHDSSRRRVLAERLAGLEADHDLIRARLEVPRRLALDPDRLVLDVEDVQSGLDRSEAVLQYFVGEERSHAWLVTGDGLATAALPGKEDLRELVAFHVDVLSSPDLSEEHQRASARLHRVLLGPLSTRLARVRQLVIVPDGCLHLVPFETLTPENGLPVLARRSVRYVPSLALLSERTEDRRAARTRPALLVADPASRPGSVRASAGAASVRGDTLEATAYERGGFALGPLEHARSEVQRIAQLFEQRTVLTGRHATEDALKALRLSRFGVLHFATHGLSDDRVPMRSALVLGREAEGGEDGFLQVREILELPLDADLVVLSGCRTGRGRIVDGEGVLGLSRAFLVAGARSLVVSLWNVDDRSTALLMEAFHGRLRRGDAPAEALRLAKLTLRRREGGRYAAPYYWAPFVLVGGRADAPR